MRICFVSPPTVVDFTDRLVPQSEAVRLIFEHAPSGILGLAAVLEQQGYDVDFIDLNAVYYEYVCGGDRRRGVEFCVYAAEKLAPLDADVFGFGTICGSYPLTVRLARTVSQTHPGTPIVLGGPQASVVDVATLESFPFVDLIVRGEAEQILPRVLESVISNPRRLELIAGITYRKGANICRNPNAPVIEDLDTLPLPALHLYPDIPSTSYAPLEAGRGCPFACSFCSTNDFFRRRFRMKSPEVLVAQMAAIKRRYGIKEFDLLHDMFTVDRKKVVAFCEAVQASGEALFWGCSARTDCIDDELIDLMGQSGCVGIFFGIDSGSNQVQAQIQKRLDLAEAAARIKHANRSGIRHTVSLITGFPEETRDDLRDTINFIGEALRYPRSTIQLHLLAPLAETPITTEYQDRLIFDDVFSDMSFQGWDQDPEERTMIVNHPKIFPNFYGVPTRWLDRFYLRELREFMLHSIVKARWLMTLLHRDSGDLLTVFDRWLRWSYEARCVKGAVDTSRKYYSGETFPQDLARFVLTDYALAASYPHLVRTMALVDCTQYSFRKRGTPKREVVFDSLDAIPIMTDDAELVVVEADYKKLLKALKRKERLDSIEREEVALILASRNGQLQVLQLNRAGSELLRLCDGSRTINQIAGQFASGKKLGVSSLQASFHGLVALAEQGFIDVKRAQS